MWLSKEDEEDISDYPAIKWGNQHEQDGADKYNSIYQANKITMFHQMLNFLSSFTAIRVDIIDGFLQIRKFKQYKS